MERTFRCQKLLAVLFVVGNVVLFVLHLGFMSDFKDLFGLQLKANKPVAYLHDVLLQGFNKALFQLSVIAILIAVGSALLHCFSRVPDRFALIVMEACLVFLLVRSIMLFVSLAGIEQVYLTTNFSKVRLEGGFDYIPRIRTFAATYVILGINITLQVAYALVLFLSHLFFIREKGATK